MRCTRVQAIALVLIALASPAFGQEDAGDWQQVVSPYQEGFKYSVGDDLRPRVEIDGLRWTRLNLATKGEREIQAGEETPMVLTLEFENRAESSREARIILLFQDSVGRPLERISLDSVKVGSGKFEEDRQKLKISGDTLLNMTELYIYCEVE